MKKALVSVVITTKNSSQFLEELLLSIREQRHKKIELIVVDNNSRDETKEIVKKYTQKVFNFGPERSAQRNYGAKKSIGEYLLFLDADMLLTPNVIKDCLEKTREKSNVGGVVIPETSFGKGFWAKTKIFERKLNLGEPYFEAARFFPKRVFWKLGGYDEALTGPEDWDLSQRIGEKHEIVRIKSKILHNEGRPTLIGLLRRKYYYGLSVNRYLTKDKKPLIGTRTVYFLRPGFYKNINKMLGEPVLTAGMLIMLISETIGGFCGYIVGRFKKQT